MKKLFIILSLLFGISDTFAADRVATSTDVTYYATNFGETVVVGDYIIDTPFSTSGGLGQIYITNAQTKFSGIRTGGTIWLDASVLPDLFNVYITNETAGVTWSSKCDITHPIRIRPLAGQIITRMTAASNTARMWLIADIANVEINGYHKNFPGMKQPWSGPLRNTFGFVIDGGTVLSKLPFQMMVDGDHSGMSSIDILNIELANGYCLLRIMPGNTNLTLDRISLVRLYGHDTIDGEGGYIMQTTGTPFAKCKKIVMYDCVWARTATEAWQFQHGISGTEKAIQEHYVSYAPATRWKEPFEQYQDNGNQYATDEGWNNLRNAIIHGAANTQLSVLPYTGTDPGKPVIIENMLLTGGRYIGVYTGTTASGSDWIFRNIYLKDFNNTYPELTEGSTATYMISENNPDRMSFMNIVKDNSRTNLFENSAVVNDIIGTSVDTGMPDPDYNVPPFPGKNVEEYEFYTEEYATRISGHQRQFDKVDYATGNIVGSPIVGTGFRYYICTSGHTSGSGTHPESDATHWSVITWDAEGDPSYSVDWDSGDAQTYYPWDDFRLTADSYWNLLNIGIRSNFRNTDKTVFQWYEADDAIGTNTIELAGERDPSKLITWAEDEGKYVRLKCFFKDSGGTITEHWVNSWTLVN